MLKMVRMWFLWFFAGVGFGGMCSVIFYLYVLPRA